MKWILVILLLGGCTICESPYIQKDGECCLDNDNDFVCDDKNPVGKVTQEPEPIIEKTDDAKAEYTEYEFNIEDLKIQTTIYEDSGELSFFVSNQDFIQLQSASMEFIPECIENHVLIPRINDKLLEPVNIACDENTELELGIENIVAGKNTVSIAAKTEFYLIKNITFILNFPEPELQIIPEFEYTPDKKLLILASDRSVRLSNFHEIEFEVDDYLRSEVNLTFAAKDRTIVILNSKVIHDGMLKSQAIVLPEDMLLEKNTLKIIALEQ